MKFEIVHTSSLSKARLGRIHTPHGIIETPNFVPVATHGTVKGIDNQILETIGISLIFCNTYHLMLHPGTEIIKAAGGIHSFIQRTLPIITDSGGFQIFSLAHGSIHEELKKKQNKEKGKVHISEEGALFRSYRDGAERLLTPENSIEAQKAIGADIIIPLDELPPYHIDTLSLHHSVERTHRWQKRSLETHLKNPQNQAIYGVIHGGTNLILRAKSCHFISSLPFDGFAIGGSMGKEKKEMIEIVTQTVPLLPRNYPLHILGIGDISSIAFLIPFGIDTFDSSYPTKAARHGIAFTQKGAINLTKQIYSNQFKPIDPECNCPTCNRYSSAYLHHLFKAHELTALSLTSIHNIYRMNELMSEYRKAIAEDRI